MTNSQQDTKTTVTYSAQALAQAIRERMITAVNVVENHLDRIAKHDSEIHAFNTVIAEQALSQASSIDDAIDKGETVGPLAGVPIAIKDNICTRGIPTTCSSKILEGWLPPYDATVVSQIATSGAIIVGKTNMDEFAMGSSTENSAFGVTHNPRKIGFVPGGSSGGSAAAVAAGFTPLSLGSDTGGSIRQPASLCGVVGVKPTYGLVSRYGLIAFASSLDQIGPFAHTVEDAAILLDVLSGHDHMDSTSISETVPSAVSALGQGVDGMRVGIIKELLGEGIDPEVIQKTKDAALALEKAGAIVEEVSIPAVLFGLSAYYLIAPAEASSNLSRYDGVRYGLRVDAATTGEMNTLTRTAGFGDEVKRRIMLGTYALSAGYYDAYYGKALKVRSLIAQDFAKAYENFDLLLTPTSPTTAFPIGDLVTDPLTMYMNDVCTIPTNLAGHPAMSVPFGNGSDGLPIGIQVLAPALGEVAMFRAAEVLESSAGVIGVANLEEGTNR